MDDFFHLLRTEFELYLGKYAWRLGAKSCGVSVQIPTVNSPVP
jgi:hypothetical protein